MPHHPSIARLQSRRHRGQSYEATLAFGTELRTAAKDLSEFFQAYLSPKSCSDSCPTLFHDRLLNTVLRRILLNLYRPFALKAIKDPLFYLSRRLSLDSALIIASYAESPGSPDETPHQSTQDFYRLCLSGADLFKGPLSQDVIVVIGLELITQIEEEIVWRPTGLLGARGSTNTTAQDNRDPLLRGLQKIQNILYQSVSAGITGMKGYCLLCGVLAQAQAVHLGDLENQAEIREALLESMRACRSVLEQFIASEIDPIVTDDATLAPEEMNGWDRSSATASYFGPNLLVHDLGFNTFTFWDCPPPPTSLDRFRDSNANFH